MVISQEVNEQLGRLLWEQGALARGHRGLGLGLPCAQGGFQDFALGNLSSSMEFEGVLNGFVFV